MYFKFIYTDNRLKEYLISKNTFAYHKRAETTGFPAGRRVPAFKITTDVDFEATAFFYEIKCRVFKNIANISVDLFSIAKYGVIIPTIICVFVLQLVVSGFAGQYAITLSPVYLSDNGKPYISGELIYNSLLQKFPAGAIVDNNKIHAASIYEVKTKAVVIATVFKNGLPAPGVDVIWKINPSNSNASVGFVSACGAKITGDLSSTTIKTATFTNPTEIVAQPVKLKDGGYFGSNEYTKVNLLPGQSFIELSSAVPGYTELAAIIKDEDDPAKNTVYTAVEWVLAAGVSARLSLADNGAVNFYGAATPAGFAAFADTYCELTATVALNSGKIYSDILTVQLPPDWNFLVDDKSQNIISNFNLLKNGVRISGESLAVDYGLITGVIKNETGLCRFVSIKLTLDDRACFDFKIKIKPLKTIEFEDNAGCRIFNSTAMLLESGLITSNAITLLNAAKYLTADYFFSDLNAELSVMTKPAVKGAPVKYELKLINNGYGNIRILEILANSNISCAPAWSKLIIYPEFDKRDSIFAGRELLKNYLDKPSQFVIGVGGGAVLDFEFSQDIDQQLIKTGVLVKFELSRRNNAGQIERLESEVRLNELTSVFRN